MATTGEIHMRPLVSLWNINADGCGSELLCWYTAAIPRVGESILLHCEDDTAYAFVVTSVTHTPGPHNGGGCDVEVVVEPENESGHEALAAGVIRTLGDQIAEWQNGGER